MLTDNSVILLLLLLLFICEICIAGGSHGGVKYSRSIDTRLFSPDSPCPNIFQYSNNGGNDPASNDLIGVIKIDPFEQNGQIQLDVQLCVGNSVNGYNGKITLAKSKEKVLTDIFNRKPIFYKVFFPNWINIPPKITKISVNGNVICRGPEIPIQVVQVLTRISLQHKLTLGVTPLISDLANGLYNPESPFRDVDQTTRNERNLNNPFIINPGFNPETAPSRTGPFDNNNNNNNNNPKKVYSGNPFFNPQETTLEQNNNNVPKEQINPFLIPVQTTTAGTPTRGGTQTDDLTSIENVCGRPITTNSLIVNGQEVPRGAYPWLVAIFRQIELNLSYICSGSLISDRHVVTAAHCVKIDNRKVKPSELICIFGKLNIRKWATTGGEKMLDPESITVHPDYEAGSANADIAILTFSEPIEFSKLIRPVCLWSGSNDLNLVVGNVGTVVGWGKDENGDTNTAEPKQVGLPIVSQESCLRSDRRVAGAFLHITSDKTFCAGYRNGTGPCNGDSGSGFLLRRNGIFYLRGIVSTAVSDATHKSCNLNEYVVFTDASKYLDWIETIIKT